MSDKPSLPPDLYTKDYFLHACEGYEEFSETQGRRLSRRLGAAFAVATVEPGMRVLDVGCGRGEILRHCAKLGADAYGIDYAPVAVDLSKQLIERHLSNEDQAGAEPERSPGKIGVAQADAKQLPFSDGYFDRVVMFDVVEHLYPWELDLCLGEVHRVLKPGGAFIAHTAPNVWYDRYAYPVVRLVRTVMGQGAHYPANPRAFNVAANVDVHVNEQSQWGLGRTLRRSGFSEVKVWLDSPPQHRHENKVFAAVRFVLFNLPPFRYFFEREVFAVGHKAPPRR
jgi:cyclopropane fatty-acyl-phospholipid synthase-like methyltransferase